MNAADEELSVPGFWVDRCLAMLYTLRDEGNHPDSVLFSEYDFGVAELQDEFPEKLIYRKRVISAALEIYWKSEREKKRQELKARLVILEKECNIKNLAEFIETNRQFLSDYISEI